jgi:hypothetical protein
MKELRQKLIDRMIILKSGCWEWQRALRNTYGVMKYEGKNESAHRLSYRAFRGEIPDGLLVCHKCDNRKCINPKHLFIGTYSDNTRDCLEKGRLVIPKGVPYKKGYRPANILLSLKDAKIIKALIRSKKITLKDISDLCAVPHQLVRDMSAGRSYINI